MTVHYGEIVATLSAQVVVGEGLDLMGRDWLGRLNVNIGQVNLLEHDKISPMPTYSCHCPTSPNNMSLSRPTKGCLA